MQLVVDCDVDVGDVDDPNDCSSQIHDANVDLVRGILVDVGATKKKIEKPADIQSSCRPDHWKMFFLCCRLCSIA